MKKHNYRVKHISTILLVIFIISTIILNYSPFTKVLLGLEPLIHVYNYQSSDCLYKAVEYPEKGAGFEYMYQNFLNKQKTGEIPGNVVLCRTFRKNFLKFWNWQDYLTNDRWKLKYVKPCPADRDFQF